jgi:hypothetical protein
MREQMQLRVIASQSFEVRMFQDVRKPFGNARLSRSYSDCAEALVIALEDRNMQVQTSVGCAHRHTALRVFGRECFMLAKQVRCKEEGSRGRGKSSRPLPTPRSMTAHPLVSQHPISQQSDQLVPGSSGQAAPTALAKYVDQTPDTPEGKSGCLGGKRMVGWLDSGKG